MYFSLIKLVLSFFDFFNQKKILSFFKKNIESKISFFVDVGAHHGETIKIFINTVYGYFGNKHAPMGDPDISRSITLTGQAVIKQSNKILTKYICLGCGILKLINFLK